MDACRSAVFPGSTSGIRKAAEAFGEFAAGHGLGEDACWPFRVALDETLSNIVKYAYAGRPAGEIEVEFRISDGELSLAILDDGAPFDPLRAPRPDLGAALEHRRAGGLGISLLRGLMDSVAYERRGDRNRLVLKRRLDR
jgi:anti-sigma regulatory factor (Ser/Thr protein kinase)